MHDMMTVQDRDQLTCRKCGFIVSGIELREFRSLNEFKTYLNQFSCLDDKDIAKLNYEDWAKENLQDTPIQEPELPPELAYIPDEQDQPPINQWQIKLIDMQPSLIKVMAALVSKLGGVVSVSDEDIENSPDSVNIFKPEKGGEIVLEIEI